MHATPQVSEAYSSWAPHYDESMAHPDYSSWVRRLESLSSEIRPRGERALDVGCGTGKSTVPLVELGYAVTACEPCAEMLERAETKLGPAVRWVRHSLPELPKLGEFDYVSCLNDVVNYLLEEADLEAAFRALGQNLAPDGVLVFDTSTQALYRGCYASLRWRETERAAVLWRGETPVDFESGGVATAAAEIFTRDGDMWHRRTSHHVQRHFPEAVVQRALADAGLHLRAVYGQYDDGRLDYPLIEDEHTKAVHVVTRLP